MNDRHHEDHHVHLHVDFSGLEGIVAALVDRSRLHHIVTLLEELKAMSGTLADQLTAALASISADVDTVSTEVTALLAQLSGQVGQPVTQAMVDAATGIDARLKAIPPAPTGGGTTHMTADPNDSTPNGSLKADGVTVRNAFDLPGFNPALPETT